MEAFWLLVLSVAVVVAVAIFKKFVIGVSGLGSLAATIVACVIAAGIYTKFISDGKLFEFGVVCIIIYGVSNLGFQLLMYLSGQWKG